MRHVALTCLNHGNLRWSTKSIAVTPHDGGRYNGARHIFFHGVKDEQTVLGVHVGECACPADDLRIAPEDPWYGLDDKALREASENDWQ